MTKTSFLKQLATALIQDQSHLLEDKVIILPNQRAKVFLLDILKDDISATMFAPKIMSIEEFVAEVSKLRTIDPISQVFEFYNCYLNLTPKDEQHKFEFFANWAKILLQDFNEIDRYLLDPVHVFSYLKDIEAIKRWDLEPHKTTTMIDNHLRFWEMLPVYYNAFYEHLCSQNIGYQGLLYREAVNKISEYSKSLRSTKIIFGGFNALNRAEEKIIQYLLSQNQAKIYWDTDAIFLNDPYHDAGLFARRTKAQWPYYKTFPYEWINSGFAEKKNIEIIGTPKTIGQAKIAGNIIKELIATKKDLKEVAVVLGDENILVPLLYALPNEVETLNITMGYAGKNNPAQILISKLFKLHTQALKRNKNAYVYFYKDVLDVLNNPLVLSHAEAHQFVDKINKNNITFFQVNTINKLHPKANDFFQLLMQPWTDNVMQVLERISDILITIRDFLKKEDDAHAITNAFVFAIYKQINKLINYCEKYPHVTSVEMLEILYKQTLDMVEVAFEGKPLEGLQIMGVLESRVLDFDTVIITSLNEGTFPAGKTQNSFIPLDVKRELGLPTFKEKDAIYAYHFYHLLQRAKNVYLLYNTEAEGLDAGEKSRFITQLLIEKLPNHDINHHIYTPTLPQQPYEPMCVSKSNLLLERLFEIAKTGFSPSSLTNYMRNPMQFYFQRVLRIDEANEVEENIAANTLGTIIHNTLENLYKPVCHKILTRDDVAQMHVLLSQEVLMQFKAIYKEGDIASGKNLLAFEVAKRHIQNFLKLEEEAILNGDVIEVLHLELKEDRNFFHENLPVEVLLKGSIDRVERRNGTLRIVDYKTGKVEPKDLKLSQWEGLTLAIKNDKIIQLLSYAFILNKVYPNEPIEAGIVSFKNLKSGFMPFQIVEGRTVVLNTITTDTLSLFANELSHLIAEILNPAFDFKEPLD